MATIVKTPLRIKRKQSIIRGALKAFCERGINGATVDDICAKAECSHGLFYHYYENKEQLLFDIKMAYTNKNENDEIKEIAESNAYVLSKIKEVLTRFFSLIKEDEDFAYTYYFFLTESIRNDNNKDDNLQLYNPIQPYLNALEYLIYEGVYLGEISNKFKKEDLVFTLYSILTGAVLNYIALPKELKSVYKLPSVDLIIETIKGENKSALINLSVNENRLSI